MIKQWFNQYVQSQEFNHNLKEMIINPVCASVYNDIYIYVWLICVYHIFLAIMTLFNLYLLSKLSANNVNK